MKKGVLLLGLIFITFCLSAQWQQNGNNMFFNSGNIGIGTNNPEYFLDIHGDAGYYSTVKKQFISLSNVNNSTHSYVSLIMTSGTEDNSTKGGLGTCAYSYIGNPGLSGYSYLLNRYSGIAIRSENPSGNIKFITGGYELENERMRIDGIGNIGIGTDSPCTKLHIESGDILLEEINSGIIMTSPNGSFWRVTVDDNGMLQTMLVESPCGPNTSINKLEERVIDVDLFPNPSEDIINIVINSKNLLKLKVKSSIHCKRIELAR